jgi:uncharacterized protein YggE
MKLALAALAAVAAVALAGGAARQAHGGAAAEIASGITVTGTGFVTTVPDRAAFSFGVQSRGKTAAAALDANSTELARVIAALKAAGVAAEDIQTAQVSLYPRTTTDGQTVIGYDASNSVSAKLRDLDLAGDVVDGAVRAGANTVYGPSLFKSDSDAIARAALKAAMANARAKADAIAAAAGVQVGRVTHVLEGGNPTVYGPVPVAAGTPQAATAAPARTPIQPGTQEQQAFVTVTFSIA